MYVYQAPSLKRHDGLFGLGFGQEFTNKKLDSSCSFYNSPYRGWFQYTMATIYIVTTHRNIHTVKCVKHGYT